MIARGSRTIARLVPAESDRRELGFSSFVMPASFFDDLPDDQLAAWDGD